MKAKRLPGPIDRVFRAKADTGWTKASIYSYVKDEIDVADEDLPMFSIEQLTDKDCQEFADKEFAIDNEREEDDSWERGELAVKLYFKITKR